MARQEQTNSRESDRLVNGHNRQSSKYVGKELYLSDIDALRYDYIGDDLHFVAVQDNKYGTAFTRQYDSSKVYQKLAVDYDIPFILVGFSLKDGVAIEDAVTDDIQTYDIRYIYAPDWLSSDLDDSGSITPLEYFQHIKEIYEQVILSLIHI